MDRTNTIFVTHVTLQCVLVTKISITIIIKNLKTFEYLLLTYSQLIKREEQNLIASVGIDIISLLDQKQGSRSGGQQSAPKAAGGAGAGSSSSAGGPASATGIGRPKKRERGAAGPKSAVAGANSLFVMCMKRLLPLGMSVLGGQEHELLQFAKARLIAGNYQEAEADAPEAPVPNSVRPISDNEWELCWPENEYKSAKC